MQYYRDTNGEIYAYEDDVDVVNKTGPVGNDLSDAIPDGLTAMTQGEIDAHLLANKHKPDKLKELQQAHDATLAQGVTSYGRTFSLDTLKRQFDIMAMAAGVKAGLEADEKPRVPMMDGERVEMDDQHVLDLAAAMRNKETKCANRLSDLQGHVRQCKTKAEVESITWSNHD